MNLNEKANPFFHQKRMMKPCEAKTHIFDLGDSGRGEVRGLNYPFFCPMCEWGIREHAILINWYQLALIKQQKTKGFAQ